MTLQEIITDEITRKGPVSFRRYMEMALYYPGLGYYNSSGDKIGSGGDYYTSANLTPLFGATIGVQLEEMWKNLGEIPFTIVEMGAGTGLLCHDILDYLKDNTKLFETLNYYIIEQSPIMREKEQSHLFKKVTWFNSIENLPEITGCFLSNELLDNFPVNRVVMKDKLMEVFVDYENNKFIEVLKPCEKSIVDYLKELDVVLPSEYKAEINLEAKNYLRSIAAHLKKGYVITIDYGYNSNELYSESHSKGTLMCYHRHQVNDNPYINIGDQDITAHVNFSALLHWGLKNGLEPCGISSQANFLLALGFMSLQHEQDGSTDDIAELATKKALQTHTLLLEMGTRYKVLIQQKGMEDFELLGLKNPLLNSA